jgi:simple sugar transport system ATP-binding protein
MHFIRAQTDAQLAGDASGDPDGAGQASGDPDGAGQASGDPDGAGQASGDPEGFEQAGGDPGAGGRDSAAPLLSARGIQKRFGGVIANDVDLFEVRAGEVHALLGENGAGKSTLSKILYGYYRSDAGEILVRGRPVLIDTPARARALGIGMVFQDFTLIPALSVFENVALFMAGLPRVLRRRALAEKISGVAASLHLAIDLRVPAGALSVGQQQKVEVLKQVMGGARVLILDEPTKVLAPPERAALFATIAQLRTQGYGIVFITHKMNEVIEIADRVSVMRKGRVVGRFERPQLTEAALLALMFDERMLEAAGSAARRAPGRPALELRGVSTRAEGHALALDQVTLEVRAGEIVGVAGVAGSGQRELGALVLGKTRPSRGSKLLWGADAGAWSIARARQSGVAFIPENPLELACVGELGVTENFVLGARRYRRGLGVDWVRARADAAAAYARLDFARPPLAARVRTLSGGNVQRLVMAREFAGGPRLIVALYPTRGLDVRSAQAVREKLAASAAQGVAVLLMSEELEELFGLCDRIVVLNHGRVSGVFEPPAYAPELVGAAMVGASGARRAA